MKNQNTNGGIGFVGLLTILFVGLKLTDNIDWSWWWVVSPLWIIPVVIIGCGILWFAGCVIIDICMRWKSK
jgi:hypothetical protein